MLIRNSQRRGTWIEESVGGVGVLRLEPCLKEEGYTLSRCLFSSKNNGREMRMVVYLIICNRVGKNSWEILPSDHYCPYREDGKRSQFQSM